MERQKKPFILISNDDGYRANGIRFLVDMLRDMADLLVCAPDSGRSGYSCAFSAVPSLTLKRRDNMGEGVEVWSCSGTPADCVKIAFDQLCNERRPDLVIGGINHGENSTVNCHYSGTVGIAMEGTMKYIPSIAFSSCDYSPAADLTPLRDYVRKVVELVLNNGLPKGIFLNVNFPKGNCFKGVRICRMSYGRWVNEVAVREHPRGYKYYWMIGEYVNDEPSAPDTDQTALAQGYVAITPSKIDVTSYEFMEELKHWDF